MTKPNKLKTYGINFGKAIATVFAAVFSLITLLTKIVFAVAKLPMQIVGKLAELGNNKIKGSDWSKNHSTFSSILRAPIEAVKMLSELSSKALTVCGDLVHIVPAGLANATALGSFDLGKKITHLLAQGDFLAAASQEKPFNFPRSKSIGLVQKIDNLSGATSFDVDANKAMSQSFSFKKGTLDLEESAIGNFVNKIRRNKGKSENTESANTRV